MKKSLIQLVQRCYTFYFERYPEKLTTQDFALFLVQYLDKYCRESGLFRKEYFVHIAFGGLFVSVNFKHEDQLFAVDLQKNGTFELFERKTKGLYQMSSANSSKAAVSDVNNLLSCKNISVFSQFRRGRFRAQLPCRPNNLMGVKTIWLPILVKLIF